jgi:hypothetical protein
MAFFDSFRRKSTYAASTGPTDASQWRRIYFPLIERYSIDTFNIYYEASCQGLYCKRKLCKPQHVSIMVSRMPSFKRRMLSFTIL